MFIRVYECVYTCAYVCVYKCMYESECVCTGGVQGWGWGRGEIPKKLAQCTPPGLLELGSGMGGRNPLFSTAIELSTFIVLQKNMSFR